MGQRGTVPGKEAAYAHPMLGLISKPLTQVLSLTQWSSPWTTAAFGSWCSAATLHESFEAGTYTQTAYQKGGMI